MADNERFLSDSTPGGYPHIPPEVIEAFKKSPLDIDKYYQEARENDGELISLMQIIAERFRKEGNHNEEYKRGVLVGMLATLKLVGLKEESQTLAKLFELPAHTDEIHTPADPPLSA